MARNARALFIERGQLPGMPVTPLESAANSMIVPSL